VEKDARTFGIEPVTVLNVPFDTPERREFARRLGSCLTVQDDRLKGLAARILLSRPSHRGRPEWGSVPGSEGVWGERGAGKG